MFGHQFTANAVFSSIIINRQTFQAANNAAFPFILAENARKNQYILQMKTSFDLITHTSSGKHRNQRDRNDRADRQYNSGPPYPQRLVKRMIHQKFD